jgi:hypothetical protein
MNHWPTPDGVTRSLKYGTNSRTKWYPIPVDTWRRTIRSFSFRGEPIISEPKVVSNLSYNLQYMEYIQQCLIELRLSEVLERQSIKSYVIVTVSVIECLLHHLNRLNGGKERRLANVLSAIKAKKLLGDKEDLYGDLDRYRDLRNKVHIYELKGDFGTDYQAFGRGEYNKIRKILHDLVSSPSFGLPDDQRAQFSFLKIKLNQKSA